PAYILYRYHISYVFYLLRRRPPAPTLFPYTTLFRSEDEPAIPSQATGSRHVELDFEADLGPDPDDDDPPDEPAAQLVTPADAARDRKSTRLNSSHRTISYAVFCLKKKNDRPHTQRRN